MTRAEYIAQAKAKALAFVSNGDLSNALASITADLNAREDTRGHQAPVTGTVRMMAGQLTTAAQMKAFIEGIE